MSLWVEIIACEFETSWYFDCIGAVVEVTDRSDQFYQVFEMEPDKPWERKLINKKEAKIIE